MSILTLFGLASFALTAGLVALSIYFGDPPWRWLAHKPEPELPSPITHRTPLEFTRRRRARTGFTPHVVIEFRRNRMLWAVVPFVCLMGRAL